MSRGLQLFRRAARVGAALTWLCMTCTFAATAALPTPGSAPAPAKAAAAASPTDVGEWSKQTAQRLFEIKERLAGPSDVASPRDRLKKLETRIDATIGQLIAHPEIATSFTEAAMHDTDREITSATAAADAVGNSLTQLGNGLEALLRDLDDIHKRATAMRASADDGALPEALRIRLDMIITDATQARHSAQHRLDQVATSQNEILVLDERMHTAREELARAEAKRAAALFELQQPPLWRVTGAQIDASIAGSGRFVGRALPSALQFVRDSAPRVVLHLALLMLGVAFVIYLRKTFDTALVGAPPSRGTSRPFSASLLVMLLVAPFVYPDAPSSVAQILGVVLIVPMLRILTLYLERGLHPALYSLAAVFLLERVSTAFARDIVLQRLVLLLLSVVTIALLTWARSRGVGTHLELAKRVTTGVRRLNLIGIVLSVVSLLLNVLGNVDLAMLLQSATVRAAALAAGLYAAVLVVDEVARLCVHSMKGRGVRSVTNHDRKILTAIHRLVTLTAFVVWGTVVLSSFRALTPLTAAVGDVLNAKWSLGQVTVSLGRTLGFVVAIWAAVHASRITQVLLHDDVLPRFALPRGVPAAISTVANYAMVLLGILLGAGILGIEMSNLTLIISALGVGIGFGLQNVVNNFVSGFILIFERTVQVGDAVQLSDLFGKVTHIGLRASQIRTFSGSEVIVPNGELISNRVVNWTMSDRHRRLEASVGVAYGTDPERVRSLLYGVLDAESEIMKQPEPMVIFEAFGDSSLNFRLFFWVMEFDIGHKITDRVNTGIAQAFAAAGIEIPFPQRDVHIKDNASS